MNQATATIDELLRLPLPASKPLALACDGPNLWVGSNESGRLYGINAQQGTVFEECAAPGDMFGACVTGDALRVIVSSGEDDDRSIRRYIFGKDFKSESLPCPGNTGSFLAYDGDSLFVSQRFDRRIVEIDDAGTIIRTIPTPREVTGMTIVGGLFYLITTESPEVDDYRLLRLDAHGETPAVTELASLPFAARSLAFDGTRFWTAVKGEPTLVAFAKND